MSGGTLYVSREIIAAPEEHCLPIDLRGSTRS